MAFFWEVSLALVTEIDFVHFSLLNPAFMKFHFSLFLTALLGLLISCSSRQEGQSDNRFSEERKIDGVKRLKISGVFNLNLTQSDQESLSLDGNPEIAKKLKVTQEGDMLILELEELNSGLFDDNELNVNLSVSDLRELEFEGVGNIKTTGNFSVESIKITGDGIGNLSLDIDAKDIDANLNMMGNMTLRGKAATTALKNEGIGNVDAAGLITQKLDLRSSGIGKVAVHCEGELSLQVDGIGAVSYSGNPTVIKEEVNGIGKVTRN